MIGMSLSSGARSRDLKAYNIAMGKSCKIAFTVPCTFGFNFTSVGRKTEDYRPRPSSRGGDRRAFDVGSDSPVQEGG